MKSFEARGEKPTTPESRLLLPQVKRAEQLVARAEAVHVDGQPPLDKAENLLEEAKKLEVLAEQAKKPGRVGVSQEAVNALGEALTALEEEVKKMENMEADL